MFRRVRLSALSVLFLAAAACSSHASNVIVSTPNNTGSLLAAEPSATQVPWKIYPIPDMFRMVVGHDGNVWAIGEHNEYGRITTTGNVVTMTFPDPTQSGQSIAANPDGNVYVLTTSGVTCHLYQIHPDMSVSDMFAPFSCTNVGTGMVSGYDQRLWILNGTASIVRVDLTDGSISTLPMPDAVAFYINRGPSTGRAMYAESSSAVYRIAPDDSITSVQLPLDDGGLAVSNDGYSWTMVGGSPRQIARIDDHLGTTFFTFSDRRTGAPVGVLAHNGTLFIPSDFPVPSGSLYRFNMKLGTREPKWSLPDAFIQRGPIIGPDHNLWVTDTHNVYVDQL